MSLREGILSFLPLRRAVCNDVHIFVPRVRERKLALMPSWRLSVRGNNCSEARRAQANDFNRHPVATNARRRALVARSKYQRVQAYRGVLCSRARMMLVIRGRRRLNVPAHFLHELLNTRHACILRHSVDWCFVRLFMPAVSLSVWCS